MELGEERAVRIDEGFVGPRVRRPDLERGAVRGDPAHLVKDQRLVGEVLEAMRREDRADAAVGEGEGLALDVDPVLDVGHGVLVDPDETLALGVAAPDVDLETVRHRALPSRVAAGVNRFGGVLAAAFPT